jgi:hypothetical protein
MKLSIATLLSALATAAPAARIAADEIPIFVTDIRFAERAPSLRFGGPTCGG